MHDFPYYLHVVVGFLRGVLLFVEDGFHDGFYRVNAILGLIIAIFAAYSMGAWKRIWTITLGATIVYLVALVMLPVLANNAAFRLPPLVEMEYWRNAAALYLGFLVIVAVFFFIKTRVLPKGGGGH
jgi:hypothetical protein